MAERITPGTYEWDLLHVEHAQRYEFFAPLCQGRRVLDAACGTGFGSDILWRHGAASVVGIDYSEEALAYAREHFANNTPLTFRRGDCEALEALGEKFDTVISFETIEHIRHPERLIEGAKKVLNPGGRFICSTPNILRHSLSPDSTFVNEYHLSEMHYADFEALMSRHFRIESRYMQNESPAYLRHCDLANTVLTLQNSKVWRWETALRKMLGKKMAAPPMLNGHLLRSIPGDYTITPLEAPFTQQKTFILVGEAE